MTLSHVWISIPPCHESFGQGVQLNPTCLTFGSTVASCTVCAFLSLFCGMQSARYAAFTLLDLPRIYVRPFSRGSNLLFWISISFSWWFGSLRMMTDVTNVPELLPDIPHLCACAIIWFCHCSLSFLINGEINSFRWCNTLHLVWFLAIITKIVYLLFTQEFWGLWQPQ